MKAGIAVAGTAAALWLCFAVVSLAHADPVELRAGGTGSATELLCHLGAEFGKERAYRTEVVASLGTRANIANGSYPYSKLLYFVTRDQPGSLADAFLRFLDSAAARHIMAGAFVFPARAS